ncbi:thiamine-monophosphate kinase [Gracilibacillus halotolerans]|uniref:Thiamine-monophosphate kinase n=1 Tax=Gracilibacillus halotolerans TaxID=74386 RepID=A0A841RRY9_9BACI|nr:thiamine-phosphate kinase [Gracilibacillus halotolerans]MBB6513348.1 thiamine-monophosphate kinase [Gracilibacillus halotolerans]
MKEFDFIRAIQPANLRQSHVIKGIGDDAAIVRTPYHDSILTVDTMVENIHFSRKTVDPFHIGWRALAANISDIAAMGGVPIAYLVSIVVSDNWKEHELIEIYNGMDELARKYNMDLIGGDTVIGQELSISITVMGTVAANGKRYRSHARDGDVVFVTGNLGGSACGLHVLLQDTGNSLTPFKDAIRKHQMPIPNVEFVERCASIKRMALNDISDGIASEANEIAKASNISIEIEPDKLPTHKDLEHFPSELQYQWKMSGGEDFELLGTVSLHEWHEIKKIANQIHVPITKIGSVHYHTERNGKAWIKDNNKLLRLEPTGYIHKTK